MSQLDEEQLEQVKGLLNQTVNGAVATLKRNLETQITKTNEATTTTLGKLLDEKLQGLKGAPGGEGGGGEGGEGGGKQKGKDLQIANLERQVKELTEGVRQSTDKATKAELRRRQVERDRLIDAELTKAGVTDPFMREMALAHFERRGIVGWSGDDEDSVVVWNGSDGVQLGFSEGLTSWMKGEEAKRILPARGVNGSGGKPPPRTTPAGPQQKQEASLEDIGNAVLGLMSPLGGKLGE